MTPVLKVFVQGLIRSRAAAMELLGQASAGIVASDRFSAYNYLPLEQSQLCWVHLIRGFTAIAQLPCASRKIGAALLELQRQLSAQWNHRKDGQNNKDHLQQGCQPILLQFEATL